eukprot:CAMPEP_0185836598 /NCGR_PEP_ID=MMETSP1353-20130828/10014_1 /TAXON_ID=1077150 /ORGANISM="Erythrolobus australicus, Strain CCMP3124" /LENGTH=91 /DNA_ID=CAMNT_0028535407 /DNA_START=16 /DNA_END=291 /DNA_ORIENTATION=-
MNAKAPSGLKKLQLPALPTEAELVREGRSKQRMSARQRSRSPSPPSLLVRTLSKEQRLQAGVSQPLLIKVHSSATSSTLLQCGKQQPASQV